MTGMDPPQHGVHYNGFYQLPRDAVTLSEVLAERGYRTAAAVGNFALDGRFQIGQGFGTYDDRMTQRMNPTPLAEPEGVGALEREVGAPLLLRGRRGIEPTAAGEGLLRQARELLGSMLRLRSELSEFASGVQGSVRVMASVSALAEQVKISLGPVVVENRPGAGGNIGADAVAKAAPDGMAIVMGAVATHAINPWLYSRIPYDALRDFTPITRVAQVPNVLVMNVDVAQRLGIGSVPDWCASPRPTLAS